jgi:hypothetical protein
MVKITGWFTKANPRKWTFGQKLCEAAKAISIYGDYLGNARMHNSKIDNQKS